MSIGHFAWSLRKEFSREQLIQMGRQDVDVFAAGLLGVELWQNDPLVDTSDSISQLDFVRSSVQPQNVWSAGRRTGKTTAAAVKSVNYGYYRHRPRFSGNPNKMGLRFNEYTILVGSRTQAQANKIKDEAKNLLTRKESLLQGYVIKEDKAEGFPILRVKCAYTGKQFQIHSRSFRDPDNLQGFNYDLVIVDEAVRIPRLLNLVYPTIAPFTFDTMGIIDFISSPTRAKGDFYMMYQMGVEGSRFHDKDWDSYRTDSRFNSFLTEKTRAEMARKYPNLAIADVYLGGKFPEEGEEMFSVQDIVEIFIKEKFDSGIVLEGDEQPFTYDQWSGDPRNLVHCADIAKKKDFTVIYSLDISQYHINNKIPIIGFQRFRGINYPEITNRIIRQREHFNGGRIAIDSTGVGESVADGIDAMLGDKFCERVYIGSNKEDMLINLQKFIQGHVFAGPDIPPMEEEFIGYTLPDTNLVTDCVMALAVGAWVIEEGGDIGKHVRLDESTQNFFSQAKIIKPKKGLFR